MGGRGGGDMGTHPRKPRLDACAVVVTSDTRRTKIDVISHVTTRNVFSCTLVLHKGCKRVCCMHNRGGSRNFEKWGMLQCKGFGSILKVSYKLWPIIVHSPTWIFYKT